MRVHRRLPFTRFTACASAAALAAAVMVIGSAQAAQAVQGDGFSDTAFDGPAYAVDPDGAYLVTPSSLYNVTTGANLGPWAFPPDTAPAGSSLNFVDYVSGQSPSLSTGVPYTWNYLWWQQFTSLGDSHAMPSGDDWRTRLRKALNDRGCGIYSIDRIPVILSSTSAGVVFSTDCAVTPDDQNGRDDTYVWVPATNEFDYVSRAAGGLSPSDTYSRAGSISGDGRFVVYQNSIAGPWPRTSAWWVLDRYTDTRTLLPAPDGSGGPVVFSQATVTESLSGRILVGEGALSQPPAVYDPYAASYVTMPAFPADMPAYVGPTTGINYSAGALSANGRFYLAFVSGNQCCIVDGSFVLFDLYSGTSRLVANAPRQAYNVQPLWVSDDGNRMLVNTNGSFTAGQHLTGDGTTGTRAHLFTRGIIDLPATAPDNPTGVAVVGGSHTATITWLKPANDGGSPITGYTVTASPGGQTCSTYSVDDLSCTIDGLDNGVNYTFTVTARNAVGVSSSSNANNTGSVVAGTPPQPPSDIVVSRDPFDGTRATITWLAATSDPATPVIGYRVTSSPGGLSCETTGALSCTIVGLTPGVDYTFTVVAINGVGPGSGGQVVLPGDTVPPVVVGTPDRAPNNQGWYNAPLTIKWSATDNITPSASLTSAPDTVISGDGVSRTGVSGPVCDQAGNCATGTMTVSIDTTPPAVAVTGVSEGAKYLLATPPTPGCTATDSLSGLAAACQTTVTGGNANHVGIYTVTATATDRAGNTTTTITHYKVIYGWNGFDQPINDTAHQTGLTTSVFKAGSTVPAQFTLTDGAGHVVQPVSAPVWLTPVQGVATTLPVDESVYTDPADSGSTYRAAGNQWKFNWATSKAQAGYYWRVGVRLDDGETYYVNIALR